MRLPSGAKSRPRSSTVRTLGPLGRPLRHSHPRTPRLEVAARDTRGPLAKPSLCVRRCAVGLDHDGFRSSNADLRGPPGRPVGFVEAESCERWHGSPAAFVKRDARADEKRPCSVAEPKSL